MVVLSSYYHYTPPPPPTHDKVRGVYTGISLSVRPSVRLSVMLCYVMLGYCLTPYQRLRLSVDARLGKMVSSA